MNFFGVNGAAVNGSAIAAVLSGAFAVVGATAWAGATVIRPVEATTYTIVVSANADGTRVAQGQATATGGALCTAEWSISKDASALVRITAVARAFYSDVTGIATSSGTAIGTHIKAAETLATATATATAKGDRTAGGAAIAVCNYYTDISASVKRSGASTTEREGFVLGSTTAIVTANADKTMLSAVVGGAKSWATGTALQIHGGTAALSIACKVTALGASDTAYATTYSNATAKPTHTQVIEDARATTASNASVSSTIVYRPAAASVSVSLGATTDARIAVLAGSTWAIASAATAQGRLALQGQSFALCENTGYGTATAIRLAFASCEAQSASVATGMRVQFASVSYVVKFDPAVDAISNPSTPAPFSRTMHVPAQDRAMRVPYENREMRVA